MQDPISVLASLERRGIRLAVNDAGQLVSKARPGAIDADSTMLIKTHKAALQSAVAARARFEQPLSVSGSMTGPLTSSQSGLWFISQQKEGLTMYNMPVHFRLYGPLDASALQWAFQALHHGEPGLRTAFRLDDSKEPQQVILPPAECPLLYQQLDLSMMAPGPQQQQLQQLLSLDIRAPFDLSSGQLSRVQLIKLNPTEHVLIFTQHHLISDGWSIKKLFLRLRQLMRAYLQGDRQLPAPPALTFIDYARFERSSACTDYQTMFLPYWREKLAGISALHSIPTDYPRPAVLSSAGEVHFSYLPNERWQQFKQFCLTQGATAFIGVHALVALVLHHYCRDNDLVIGTPIAARDRADVDELIGFFVNTLVLRSQLDTSLSFTAFLQQILALDLEAFDHQLQRFETLPEALALPRSPSANPLFQIMLIYQAMVEFDELLPGIKGRDQVLPDLPAKTDLAIKLTETPEHVRIEWLFSTDLFAASTLAAMADVLTLCFEQLLADPQRPICLYQLVQPHPSQLTDTRCAEPVETALQPTVLHAVTALPPLTMLQQLAHFATCQPQQLAIDDGRQRWSYAELATAVAQGQQQLLQHGLQSGARLALCGSPSAVLLAWMLAAQAQGLTYLPLDPQQPPERLSQLLTDATPALLIQPDSPAAVLSWLGPVLSGEAATLQPKLGNPLTAHAQRSLGQPETAQLNADQLYQPGQPLYLIYTSGSTGAPKGVAICPQAFYRLLTDHQQRFALDSAASVLSPMTLAFDAGHMAAMLALYSGSSLRLSPAAGISTVLQQQDVSHLICPTALLQVLDSTMLGQCRYLIFGGEACPDGLPARFPAQRLFNLYGPTEATVTAFCEEVKSRSRAGSLAACGANGLGEPVSHIRAFVLNDQGQLCAAGMAGELVLSGPQLALGYWQAEQQQIAADAGGFCRGFYAAEPDLRVYRTGDMVRRHGDGQLEFLGRRDQQLKLRGYRIEPQEIITTLKQLLPALRQCHVLVRAQQLCAYAVCDGEPPATASILQQLAKRLPPYLVPTALIWLIELPLTANGKVNASALPDPHIQQIAQTEPLALLEAQLLQIWQQVLPGQYGADADYFAIGGDSLRSIRLSGLIRELGYQCDVRDLFEQRTIRQLALLLSDPKRRQLALGEQGKLQGRFPLQPIQRWFVRQQYQNPGLFNQAVLFSAPVYSHGQWRNFLDQLLAQHDVLGLEVELDAGWQYYAGAPVELLERDASNVTVSELLSACNSLQQFNLDPALRSSSLCRFVVWRGGARVLQTTAPVLQTTSADADLVLFICHHLLVDVLSWPLLLSDLRRICRSDSLSVKTHSYRQWGEQLAFYRQQHSVQLSMYRQLCQQATPCQAEPATNPQPALLTLTPAQTALLLGPVHQALGTDPADLLLLAIGRTLALLGIAQKPLLALESHGRQNVLSAQGASLDVSRTVGWFSNITPVLVDTTQPFAQMLTASKDQRRLLPDQGLGFLLWATEEHSALELPAVVLNYHGVQTRPTTAGQHEHFSALRLTEPLRTIAPENQHYQLISLHGAVLDGQLQLRQIGGIDGVDNQHLMDLLQNQLQTVLTEASTMAMGGLRLTLGDMPTAPTDSTELSLLQQRYPLQTVLAATPLQQSMLALALREPTDRAYHQQIRLDFNGAFDPDSYRAAWQAQLQRFPALRSCLYWQQQPLELVLQQVTLPWQLRPLPASLQHAAPDDIGQWINSQAQQQLNEGMPLDEAPLLRLLLLQITPEHHVLLLLMHHAITDGWSMPNLMTSVQQHYQRLLRQQTEIAAPDHAYLQARRYLERQQLSDQQYWQQQLQQPHPGYPLSKYLQTDLRIPTSKQRREMALKQPLSVADSTKWRQFCQQQGITVSVLGLYSWHLLLQRLSGQPSSCCGYVISGRDLPIAGLGQSVGLYNNTVPLLLDWQHIDNHSSGLRLLQQQLLAANAHPACPLLQVQSRQHSWFESVFLYENYPTSPPPADALLRPQLIGEPHEPVELPLGISMSEQNGQLLLACYLDPDSVDSSLATQLLQHWLTLCWQVQQSDSWQPIQLATPPRQRPTPVLEEISLQEPPGLAELLQQLPAELQIRSSQAAVPFTELGLTSLHKVLLRQRLMRTFNCPLPVELFEQAETLYQLLRLIRHHRQRHVQSDTQRPQVTPQKNVQSQRITRSVDDPV